MSHLASSLPNRRTQVLTAQDLAAAPVGSSLPGVTSSLVKQPGGAWRRVDGFGDPIGTALSSSTVASYDYLRRELQLPKRPVL